MPQNVPGTSIIPQIAKPRLRDPVLLDQPDSLFSPAQQRSMTATFRALGALTGTSTDPAFRSAGVNYRFMSALRLELPQAALADLKVGPEDTGLLVLIVDFNHVLEWTGTGWVWGPGENGSTWVTEFLVDPAVAWWHAMDGTAAVTYLKSDGTLGMLDLTTQAGFYFRR